MSMARRKQRTIAAHPGEILRTEFMEPLGITAYRLAKELHCPGIYEVVREERGISAGLALRLGKYFGMTPQFWMNLQADYDLRVATATARLETIKPRLAAAC
ncbi:MAG: HigA family addiction module antitoxin [Candidatus Korobacteraceae bacterium]|jgi:addiction module HigA family antidote